MKITFVSRGLDMASTRYRAVLPAMALQNRGHEITRDGDVLVFNKCQIDYEVLARYKRRVYDICDDNFDCPKRGPQYIAFAMGAHAVTVNSDVMRFIVHKRTGRVATVIPDPYEHDEWEPTWGEGLLWFGHWTNVKDLARSGLEATIITNPDQIPAVSQTRDYLADKRVLPWSAEVMDEAFRSHSLVVIPTGRSMAKSANRLIESVRAGKFVVAEPLPAYEEFSRWMWVGDLKNGVEWALANRKTCMERVEDCQDYIRNKYSPDRIGEMWETVLSSI